jgi:RimJ/RimL family protein N-acetyltransferase
MIIGQAVCLGPLLIGDGPQLFSWRNTMANGRLNGPWRPIGQIEFEGWINPGGDASRVVFALRSPPDMRLLGFLQLTRIDSNARSAELGLMIGEPADRNRGLGLEAVTLALNYAWTELNLQRVALYVHGDNPAAIRCYAKAGFQIEGVMRRASYGDGQYRDITVMGCLRDEERG